jgi:hypothetical protein
MVVTSPWLLAWNSVSPDKAVREILPLRLDLLLQKSQVKIIERVRRAAMSRQRLIRSLSFYDSSSA